MVSFILQFMIVNIINVFKYQIINYVFKDRYLEPKEKLTQPLTFNQFRMSHDSSYKEKY